MKDRRSHFCQEYDNHLHPIAGTVFGNTRTPLDHWFYVYSAERDVIDVHSGMER